MLIMVLGQGQKWSCLFYVQPLISAETVEKP